MPYAPDLTEALFKAIEEQYATDGDLLQLVPNQLYRDFLPDKDSEGNAPAYPVVAVSQGEEGGVTEWAAVIEGLDVVEEKFIIAFDVAASTRQAASQIVWQIAKAFKNWLGTYPGVEIQATIRPGPPWVGSEEQGVCLGSVSFVVSAISTEEE